MPALCLHLQLYFLWMDTQVPGVLQCDNGSEFKASVEQLCELFGVKIVHGSVGNPQAQGAVERCNRTLKNKLSALLMACPTVGWSFQVSKAAGISLLGRVAMKARVTRVGSSQTWYNMVTDQGEVGRAVGCRQYPPS